MITNSKFQPCLSFDANFVHMIPFGSEFNVMVLVVCIFVFVIDHVIMSFAQRASVVSSGALVVHLIVMWWS